MNWTDYKNYTGNLTISNLVTKEKFKDQNLTFNETYSLNQNFTVIPDNATYKYCNQDMIKYGDAFPPLPQFQRENWMTYDQELVVYMFSFTALVIIGLILLVLLVKYIKNKCCNSGDLEVRILSH